MFLTQLGLQKKHTEKWITLLLTLMENNIVAKCLLDFFIKIELMKWWLAAKQRSNDKIAHLFQTVMQLKLIHTYTIFSAETIKERPPKCHRWLRNQVLQTCIYPNRQRTSLLHYSAIHGKDRRRLYAHVLLLTVYNQIPVILMLKE